MLLPALGPSTLVLVRHGESLGNVADREARSKGLGTIDLDARDADVELSPTGRTQADALAAHVRGLADAEQPTSVLSSPYRRARQTAERVVDGLDDAPRLVQDERLRERELGVFDGLTGTGISAEHPQEAARRRTLGKFYYRPPSGESWCDVALRVRSIVGDLAMLDEGERLWVFSHQAVIMAFRLVLEGLDEHSVLELDDTVPLGNCSMTTYARSGSGRLELVAAGDTSAVEESAAPETDEPETADRSTPGAPGA